MNIKQFLKNNYLIIILFLFTVLFFIFQHYFNLNWDFSVYTLNAKYLFHNGSYFELYRAPLVSVILGPLLIFGVFGEYLFLILVTLFFFFSNIKLSDTLFGKDNFKQFTFCFFSLSFFVLLFGVREGSELLALSFFELFLVLLLKNKVSGYLLGLAFLTRYNFLFFTPFLLFNKSYKKILLNILTFIAIITPWLLFNYIKFHNFFASIIESYALNILYRQDQIQVFPLENLLKLIGYFWPFLIFGLIIASYNLIKNKNKIYIFLMFLISLIILIDCFSTPHKIDRYLFNLSLPLAFFSSLGVFYICDKIKLQKFFTLLFMVLFILTITLLFFQHYNLKNNDNKFYSAAQDVKRLSLENCSIYSPQWVYISYYTENAYPLVFSPSYYLNDSIVLIFYNDITMDDTFTQDEINLYPYIYKTKDYVFLSNSSSCNKNNYEMRIVDDYCQIISQRFNLKFIENLCNFIN